MFAVIVFSICQNLANKKPALRESQKGRTKPGLF